MLLFSLHHLISFRLFTLANYDQIEPNGTITPFGPGCGSIVYIHILKLMRKAKSSYRMFDISARPCVPAGVLSFSVPMAKFSKMIGYMDESFLITESWKSSGKDK